MIKQLLIVVIALATQLNSVFAQSPTFKAYTSNNPVEVGDRFKITFELTNTKGKISPPSLVDFQVLFGPSTSQSYQFVNGKSSSSISYSYTVMALKEGTYTIGAATAETEDGTLKTDPITITVKKNSGQTQNSSSTNRSQQSQQFQRPSGTQQSNKSVDTRGNQNIFVQIELDKTKAYEGEAIRASYVLYSRYNAVELGDFETPSLTGFYGKEVKSDNNNWDPNPATVNGMRYRRAVLKQMILYPQQFGTIKIDPIEMTCVVNRSFFNPGSEVRLKSNTPSIKVKRLPSPQPGNFSGFTGNFNAKATITETDVPANEAITLKVSISGNGNLNLIQAPKIEFPDDFEVYDPKVNNRFKTTANGTSGTKEFEYLIIPRYQGQYSIPEFQFVYFNPNKKKYVTEKMGPFTFNISKGSGSGEGASIVMSNKSDVQLLGKDIRFIKYTTDLKPLGKSFFKSFLYWVLLLLPIIGVVASYLLLKQDRANKRDAAGYKKKKAAKKMAKQLAQAKSLIASDDKTFYEALFKGINDYLSDKLSLGVAQLTKENIKEKLSKQGVDASTTDKLIDAISQCEMARFAPISDVSNQTVFDTVNDTINAINQQIK